MSDTHYVEIIEIESGKIEKCMGPMPESKADTVERGVLRNLDTERYFVRTGTREELDREAESRAASRRDAATEVPAPVTAHAFAQSLGLTGQPGYEAELEDGQGLAVEAAAAADPVYRAGQHARRAAALAAEMGTTPEKLRRELLPAAMAEEQRRAHERAAENAAADVLAAAWELASAPRSALRLRRLRSAALKYGTLRGATSKKKGPRT
jgi:hypothetical protein